MVSVLLLPYSDEPSFCLTSWTGLVNLAELESALGAALVLSIELDAVCESRGSSKTRLLMIHRWHGVYLTT
uniref:Uncharacterized protein n=1 Tax=Rhizophora mucronata TaxID=61149 RepID=A0A2P2PNL6_RHIMU